MHVTHKCTTVQLLSTLDYKTSKVSRKEIVSFFGLLVVPMLMSTRLWSRVYIFKNTFINFL